MHLLNYLWESTWNDSPLNKHSWYLASMLTNKQKKGQGTAGCDHGHMFTCFDLYKPGNPYDETWERNTPWAPQSAVSLFPGLCPQVTWNPVYSPKYPPSQTCPVVEEWNVIDMYLHNVYLGCIVTCDFSQEAQIIETWENWATPYPIQVASLRYNMSCFPMPRQLLFIERFWVNAN